MKSHCRVNKGYKVILEVTVYTWDDLRFESYFEVKKLFKGLKSHCRVNKGHKVILGVTVYTWDDLRL